ncbi:MAG: bifunctional aspartate kinase/homoserine dehydrogenase I [Saprospiraceae bacterium]|nr:bifunctional aspartate kinase/homoserine dehydrogenase I [Saprospiraceae bacterium]
MKVLKFGGTSVGTPDTIKSLIDILKTYYRRGDKFAVVFSAFSKVTDTLIEMARRAAQGDQTYIDLLDQVRTRHFETAKNLLRPELYEAVAAPMAEKFTDLANVLQGIFLLREVSPRSLDFVVSFGERNSAFIIAHAMQQAGIPTQYLDARKLVRTDAQFGNAKVDAEETNRLITEYFAHHPQVQAVTGFIGSTADGLTTTLGRGGSDYTAALLGAALDAEVIEIWTDVDGVLTADPRRVKKAFTLPTMTYREAMEMSHFGAKVIYPPTIQPALAKNIPLAIKNTFKPDFPGTWISRKSDDAGHPVKGISSINQICLLTVQGSGLFGVPGIAARLFGALAQAGVNIVLITQGSSETSITFAVSPNQASLAKMAVEKEFSYELRTGLVDTLKIEGDLAVVAVVGENMRYRPGIAGRLFQALGKNGINIVAIAQGSSELNISIVVAAADETKALNAIHEAFFLSDTKTLHLFIVGVGLIGGTLLEQIRAQAAYLLENRKLEIKIVGLANSRKMLFAEEGIALEQWQVQLAASEQPFSIARFAETMQTLNLPNTIFVDNTASAEVAGFYEQILGASISISTPNKQAASSPYLQYERLKQLAAQRGVLWRYETNVGAGLPIITTLNDLIHSGDRILKIEGVLSGTLSYIFNAFGLAPSPSPKERGADSPAGATPLSFGEGLGVRPEGSGARRFSDIVREAQSRGLTEPDPRDDLSGADVRRKLLILARETGLALESTDIELEQILPADCMTAPDVAAFFDTLQRHDGHFEQMRMNAAAEGKVLRFVACLSEGRAQIGLQAVDQRHPFYFLDGSDNMVVFTTERYRERPLVIRGPGAGAEVTAAGVFAEVIGIGSYLG